MKNILHVIIISLFSLTVISCSSSDTKTTTDNTSTSTTSSPLYISVGDNGTILTSKNGLQGLREQLIVIGESPTETVHSLRLVIMEPSYPHRMEPLGLQGLLVQQNFSIESPTETIHS